jgi:hypothetical protein
MKVQTIRRVYLREAAIMLALARVAVRFIAPARVFAWADRPPRCINRFAADEVRWISWAVNQTAERRMNALCLPRALAAHAMLRRRGIAGRLCLGVARDGDEIGAHAWVEVGNDKIVGGTEVHRFTPIAVFGGTR